MNKFAILILLVVFASCTFKKSALKNQVQEGHEELYTEPAAPKLSALDEGVERVVIAATNDLQGTLNAVSGPYDMRTGGADVLGQYIKILRTTFKNIVLVDSGNFLPSDTSELKAVQEFYKSQSYDAVTVGLNDFNLKVPKRMNSSVELFKEFTKEANPPLILSNLFQLKTGRTVEWEGSKPYTIREVNGVKVGIIGLVAHDIVNKTPVHNRTGLFVEDMVQSTLRHARLLRSLGADVVVVITHEGINCGDSLAESSRLPVAKVNFEPKAPDVCNLNSEMGLFLGRLPPHLVDVVIGGRVGQKTVNYVNETLVLSGFKKGSSLNYVEFFVDKNTHKVLKDKTVVHQPVMTCHEFFKETKDCFTEDPSVDHTKKIPAKFLGQDIVPDVENKNASRSAPEKTDIKKYMTFVEAQIAYVPESSGTTQLVVFELKGNELLKIMEEDYNQSHLKDWYPSPFIEKADGLHLEINAASISGQASYRVVADLESILESPYFRKVVKTGGIVGYPTFSWNSADFEIDEVQTALAAPVQP